MCFREINNKKKLITHIFYIYYICTHTSIFYCRNYWWIWLGIDMFRPWFKDTPLSQLTRGNYYFARNQFEHEKWLRSKTHSIPNNYLGKIPRESRLGRWSKKRKFRSWNFRWLLFPYFSSRLVTSRYEHSASHSFIGNVRQLRHFITDSNSSKRRISKIDTT